MNTRGQESQGAHLKILSPLSGFPFEIHSDSKFCEFASPVTTVAFVKSMVILD